MVRVHIFGASGSGTTTLGRALAQRMGIEHFDTDDFYWEQTDPPYMVKRPVEERRRLLRERLLQSEQWALSGSLVNWAEGIDTLYTHVVLLHLRSEIRLARLAAREAERYGARMDPGGDMYENVEEFLAWAARYDEGGLDVRSRALHEQYIRTLACPVLELESDQPVGVLVEAVLEWLRRNAA